MAIWQGRSKRKQSGKRLVAGRKRRKFELGKEHLESKIGSKQLKIIRTHGGNVKYRLMHNEIINVLDPSSKKYFKAKITSVLENSANLHYVRRSVLTKGAIVETEKGKARITSRPGQHGVINGILLK